MFIRTSSQKHVGAELKLFTDSKTLDSGPFLVLQDIQSLFHITHGHFAPVYSSLILHFLTNPFTARMNLNVLLRKRRGLQ